MVSELPPKGLLDTDTDAIENLHSCLQGEASLWGNIGSANSELDDRDVAASKTSAALLPAMCGAMWIMRDGSVLEGEQSCMELYCMDGPAAESAAIQSLWRDVPTKSAPKGTILVSGAARIAVSSCKSPDWLACAPGRPLLNTAMNSPGFVCHPGLNALCVAPQTISIKGKTGPYCLDVELCDADIYPGAKGLRSWLTNDQSTPELVTESSTIIGVGKKKGSLVGDCVCVLLRGAMLLWAGLGWGNHGNLCGT